MRKPCHNNQDTGKQGGFDQPAQLQSDQNLFWSSIHLTVSNDPVGSEKPKQQISFTSSPSDHGLYYSLIYSKVSNDPLGSDDPSRLQKFQSFSVPLLSTYPLDPFSNHVTHFPENCIYPKYQDT